MIVDFNTLPNDSRLWIYQSNREFTPIELEEVETLTKKFLKNWQAHNKELEVSYQIKSVSYTHLTLPTICSV